MTGTGSASEMTRPFTNADGEGWEAVAVSDIVAHGKRGVRLAFRRQGAAGGTPLLTRVTFNSRRAGDSALRTLGENELRRRLAVAQAEGGVA